MTYLPAIIIIISALFLLIIPIVFGFSLLSAATIKTKRIVQIVATVMLALATVGVGLIWIMFAVVGGYQSGYRNGFTMIVYYSPWYITGLWIVNIGVFLIDMFGKNDRVKKRIGILLYGVVTVAVITAAYWWPEAIAKLLIGTIQS
jgi:hypothetical protein